VRGACHVPKSDREFDEHMFVSHLMAFVSVDEGRNWGGGLLLDERAGVSYPDGQQDANGLIRIVYDHNRASDRQILIAAFREEDAAAGKPVTRSVRLRQIVSAGSVL
jgi:hypothetical protein